ncbi:hypothetical protein [Methylococcus sp. EFPC2]|uniref:hypothetical protein n=1 Tax=Methylococcus sp. EFPC2 TaxID=2812648 RepID=UPI001966E681|nr:hypothetical protein [Methylococcus sp. EFPC2]QSA97735.1 hypothetical protein JWZ97_02565 [Methylococcus sp. EFPC2]
MNTPTKGAIRPQSVLTTQRSAKAATTKGQKLLRYKPKAKCAVHRLPFVTVNRKANPDDLINWFDVPPIPVEDQSDRYGVSCKIGNQLALAFLKHLREENNPDGLSCLQYIVFDIAKRGAECGVIVGFFSRLDCWLRHAVKVGGASLDQLSESDIEAEIARLMATADEKARRKAEVEKMTSEEKDAAILELLSDMKPEDVTEFLREFREEAA